MSTKPTIRAITAFDPADCAALNARLERLKKGVGIIAAGDPTRPALDLRGSVVDSYAWRDQLLRVTFNDRLLDCMDLVLPEDGRLAIALLERLGFGTKSLIQARRYGEALLVEAMQALAELAAGRPPEPRAAANGALAIRHCLPSSEAAHQLLGAADLLDGVVAGEPLHMSQLCRQSAQSFVRKLLELPPPD